VHGWLDLWPEWSRRWQGWVLRVVIGVAGLLFGLVMLWLAFFAATFGSDPADWDAESVTIAIIGAAGIVAGLWVAIRPSRASVAAVLLVVAGTLVGSAVL
jgi:uncharacterized membrane protein HdeD (DUF308 family)